jgi:ferritin
MRAQAQEELVHAMKFFAWVNERRGRVTLPAIEKPDFEWGSPLEAFEASFKHEQYITSRINDLVALAIEEKDFASRNMLNWFVDEQVEEESSVDAVLQQLRMIGDSKHGLYMIDRELGARQAGAAAEEEA